MGPKTDVGTDTGTKGVGLKRAMSAWWTTQTTRAGTLTALAKLAGLSWEFLRDSMPDRRRQRYGDVDYDWDHRVDTTSAMVGWHDRLLGLFYSPYQPTEPVLFRAMIEALEIDFRQFTFVDLGSGKGRTLLMASDWPFRRIIGVELLPVLHRTAQVNIRKYQCPAQQCGAIESICGDACDFVFPTGPIVLYLFNPLPEPGLRTVVANVDRSLAECFRPFFVLYHNPQLEHALAESKHLKRVGGTHQYVIYRA